MSQKVAKLLAELETEIQLMRERSDLDDGDLNHLSSLHSMIYSEAGYDPYNEATREFATRLLPHIQALNDKLRFKR